VEGRTIQREATRNLRLSSPTQDFKIKQKKSAPPQYTESMEWQSLLINKKGELYICIIVFKTNMSHITTQSYKKQLNQILEEELEASNASYLEGQ